MHNIETIVANIAGRHCVAFHNGNFPGCVRARFSPPDSHSRLHMCRSKTTARYDRRPLDEENQQTYWYVQRMFSVLTGTEPWEVRIMTVDR